MAVLSTMIVALAAGSVAFCSVIPPRIGTTKSFTVQQVYNPNYVKHGPTALYRAYRKYGATIPENLQTIVNSSSKVAAAGTDSGDESATPEPFDVGTKIVQDRHLL
jgi:aspergillopepsin I